MEYKIHNDVYWNVGIQANLMHTRTHSPSQAWSNAENVAHSIFESNAEDVCRNSNFSLKKMHSYEPLIGVPSFCIDQMVKPDNT